MQNDGLDTAQAGIRIAREISITSDTNDITLMAESEEELKSLLKKVKEESGKAGFNSTFRKLSSWHLVPLLHGYRWGNNGNSDRLYFLGLQNHCRW